MSLFYFKGTKNTGLQIISYNIGTLKTKLASTQLAPTEAYSSIQLILILKLTADVSDGSLAAYISL